MLAVRRGLVLPFTGACPRGNDVPSQTSVSSSAREGQEWSQSQRLVRDSVRAAALDLWAPRRRRPHLETCQGCRFPAHLGPLAATPRRARRQRFKAPSRGFLTPLGKRTPCTEARLPFFSRRQSSFVNISLEVWRKTDRTVLIISSSGFHLFENVLVLGSVSYRWNRPDLKDARVAPRASAGL